MSDNSLIDFSEHEDHDQQFSMSEEQSEQSSQESEINTKSKQSKKFDQSLLAKRRFLEDEPENPEAPKSLTDLKADAEKYLQQQRQKGVVYLSSIPRYMNVSKIRDFYSKFDVERIYLTPDTRSAAKNDGKKKESKRRLYKDGWIEFKDKRVARMVAENFNGLQVGGKKGSYNYYDTWNVRYLPKFKWDNLTERIEYDRRIRVAEFNQKLSQSKKEHDFIIGNIDKAKTTKEILKRQVSSFLQVQL